MTYGQPYATCKVCRQPIALTKGGNIYPHKGGQGRCTGAGRPPLMDHRMGFADREHGTPCLVCGAPIIESKGHDRGCMAVTA